MISSVGLCKPLAAFRVFSTVIDCFCSLVALQTIFVKSNCGERVNGKANCQEHLRLEEGGVGGRREGVLLKVLALVLGALSEFVRGLHRGFGGETDGVRAVGVAEELGGLGFLLNVLPARLLPSAGH